MMNNETEILLCKCHMIYVWFSFLSYKFLKITVNPAFLSYFEWLYTLFKTWCIVLSRHSLPMLFVVVREMLAACCHIVLFAIHSSYYTLGYAFRIYFTAIWNETVKGTTTAQYSAKYSWLSWERSHRHLPSPHLPDCSANLRSLISVAQWCRQCAALKCRHLLD